MTYFKTPFGNEPNELPVEADRYRLIWSASCPYASRTRITLDLLGLDNIISVGEVDPINTEFWSFGLDEGGVDPVLGVKELREVYQNTEPEYDGAYSVPVFVDATTGKIVRQESAEILRDFVTKFKEYHKDGAPDLYPEDLQEEIDEHNEIVGTKLMDKLFVLGKADSQKKYDTFSKRFFDHLEELNERLATNRYYHGDNLTETDIFLYVHMVRFVHVYYFLYDASAHEIEEFPHLWGYLKELYQMPAFGNNTQWDKMKTGTYLGKNNRDRLFRQIVPAGPNTERWNDPHGRDNI